MLPLPVSWLLFRIDVLVKVTPVLCFLAVVYTLKVFPWVARLTAGSSSHSEALAKSVVLKPLQAVIRYVIDLAMARR
jgi:hypothetical protein